MNQEDMNVFWGVNESISFAGCTEGTQFSPFQVKPAPEVRITSDAIFRPITMTSVDDDYPIKGIATSRYQIKPSEMLSSVENPANEIYNQGYTGMVNRTANSNGAPLYVSLPHFLGASANVTDMVNGLVPVSDKHATQLFTVLLLGATIKGDERLQFNMGFDQMVTTTYANITTGQMFPMFWVERAGELTDEQADTLKATLDMISLITLLCIVLGTGIGGFFIMIGSCCLLAHKSATTKAKIMPMDSEMSSRSKDK
jgi:CD36 antigen